MKITVEYTAQIRRAIDTAEETLDLESPKTLQKLISELADRHGDDFRELIFDSDRNLRRTILIGLNGEQINWHDEIELKNGDEISLMSPISGGIL